MSEKEKTEITNESAAEDTDKEFCDAEAKAGDVSESAKETETANTEEAETAQANGESETCRNQDKKKGKKRDRNLSKRILFDYWKTGQEYAKDNEKRYREKIEKEKAEGKKPGWSGSEKTYLIIIVLGLIGLVVKYIFF